MSDFKKLSSKLEKHGKSQAHLNCKIKCNNFQAANSSSNGSIAAKLSESYKTTVEKKEVIYAK